MSCGIYRHTDGIGTNRYARANWSGRLSRSNRGKYARSMVNVESGNSIRGRAVYIKKVFRGMQCQGGGTWIRLESRNWLRLQVANGGLVKRANGIVSRTNHIGKSQGRGDGAIL